MFKGQSEVGGLELFCIVWGPGSVIFFCFVLPCQFFVFVFIPVCIYYFHCQFQCVYLFKFNYIILIVLGRIETRAIPPLVWISIILFLLSVMTECLKV